MLKTFLFLALATITAAGSQKTEADGAKLYDSFRAYDSYVIKYVMSDNGTPDDFFDDFIVDWEYDIKEETIDRKDQTELKNA